MRSDDCTDMGGVGKVFLTTHWSLIEKAGVSDRDKNRALIELLIKKYWKPVYCYLYRRGYQNEEAKDLTQGFFQEVVLGRKLIDKADRTKGRFRSFLLTALNHYLINIHHREAAKKHIPREKILSMEIADISSLPQAISSLTPEDSFTYAWVSSMLEQVLADVKAECEKDGKVVHWQVFRDRILLPIMKGSEPPALEAICDKHGISNAVKASNMIVTVKRRFQALLQQHIRNSVMSEREAEEELKEIRRFLPKVAQDGG
jgi:DNA-directed RNA polymerase specialized sigma24 family protein